MRASSSAPYAFCALIGLSLVVLQTRAFCGISTAARTAAFRQHGRPHGPNRSTLQRSTGLRSLADDGGEAGGIGEEGGGLRERVEREGGGGIFGGMLVR